MNVPVACGTVWGAANDLLPSTWSRVNGHIYLGTFVQHRGVVIHERLLNPLVLISPFSPPWSFTHIITMTRL